MTRRTDTPKFDGYFYDKTKLSYANLRVNDLLVIAKNLAIGTKSCFAHLGQVTHNL